MVKGLSWSFRLFGFSSKGYRSIIANDSDESGESEIKRKPWWERKMT